MANVDELTKLMMQAASKGDVDAMVEHAANIKQAKGEAQREARKAKLGAVENLAKRWHDDVCAFVESWRKANERALADAEASKLGVVLEIEGGKPAGDNGPTASLRSPVLSPGRAASGGTRAAGVTSVDRYGMRLSEAFAKHASEAEKAEHEAIKADETLTPKARNSKAWAYASRIIKAKLGKGNGP